MEVSAAITPANTSKAGHPGKDANPGKSSVSGDFAALMAISMDGPAPSAAPVPAGFVSADGNVAGKPAGKILPELAGTDAEGTALLEGIPGMAAIEGAERNASMAPLPSEVPATPAPTIELMLTAIALPAAILAPVTIQHDAQPQTEPAPSPAPPPVPAQVPPAAHAQILQASVNARPQTATRVPDVPAKSADRLSFANLTGTPAAKLEAPAPGATVQPLAPAQTALAPRAVPPVSSPIGSVTAEPLLAANAEAKAPATGARNAADMQPERAEAPAAQALRPAIARTADLAADLAPGLAEAAALPAPVGAPTASPVSANPAVTAPGTPAASGPQDFQTLVDRLAEAREAASPKSVTAALSHAEFGRVSLVFRHDERVLSVGMASNDPGFAPAVQAAVASAAGTQGQQAQDNAGSPHRQDSQGQTGAQQQAATGQGEARQQASAQPHKQGLTQAGEPAARTHEEAPATSGADGTINSRSAHGRGIFA